MTKMEAGENEIYNFMKVWLLVYISLCYCYIIGKFLPKVVPRLFAVLPIVSLFLSLPLNLSSVHLCGITSFYIAWLANFKLLLFAFGKGPLCSDPSISLPRFLTLASLPIKVPQNQTHPYEKISQNQKPTQIPNIINYSFKALLLGLLIKVYMYSEYLHPKLILVLYFVHIYFFLEILLAMAASLTRFLLGVELEPQFDKPYLSTSLQDFWGRRWNLMVNHILRPTVYEPLLNLSTLAIGRRWAPLPAVFGTFCVSALMHELIYYYLGRVKPTWEITWFFLLHGFCLMVEIGLKKGFQGQLQLPRLVSIFLTVGFVGVTGFWLFFPQLLRCRVVVRACEEYAAVEAFLKAIFFK